MGRPAPPQPPKGTRPVRTGHPEFDRLYIVQANDPDIARELLHPFNVRTAIDSLRRLAPPAGMLLSINPERMLVQVDRNLGHHATLLDYAVRDALIIHDWLQASVAVAADRGHRHRGGGAGVEREEEARRSARSAATRSPASTSSATHCRTPFHRDCWTFIGGCSTFGCQGKQCTTAGST